MYAAETTDCDVVGAYWASCCAWGDIVAYIGDVLPPYTPLGSLWKATDDGVTPAADGVYVAGK